MGILKALLVACVTSLPATGLSGESTNPYAGTWVFLHGEYRLANGEVVRATKDDLIAIKTVTEDRFAVVNMTPGTFSGYLQGNFVVGENGYTEMVTSGGSGEHVGNAYAFTGELKTEEENGRAVTFWIHKGMVNGIEERETWRKMH